MVFEHVVYFSIKETRSRHIYHFRMGGDAVETRETGPSRAFVSDAPGATESIAPICHNSTFGLTPKPSDQGKTPDLMRAMLLWQRRNDR